MLEEGIDYEKAAQIIRNIEKVAGERNELDISMKNALSGNVEIGIYPYEDAKRLIEMMPARSGGMAREEEQTLASAPAKPLGRLADLERVVGSMESSLKKSVEKEKDLMRLGTQKTVLKTLSIQDQILEMERVRQGLDENTFNSDQLFVIKNELIVLYRSIKKERVQLDDLTKGMISIRDQRLIELMHKLDIKNV